MLSDTTIIILLTLITLLLIYDTYHHWTHKR